MDNELHYVTYDPDEIMREMQSAYIDAGGDFLYPGDEKEMLLRSVLQVLVQTFAGVDNALRMRTLRYAVGEYLDIMGEQRNCTRIPEKKAKTTVTVTLKAGSKGTISAGTALTADGVLFYRLVNDLSKPGIATTVRAEIEAEKAGESGNGLTHGTVMHLASYDPDITNIVVNVNASGGQNKEDDDTYRERIREYGFTSVTTGPKQQYERAAKAVTNQILDAKAINGGNGVVYVYLIVSDEEAAETIIADVESALNAENVRPLTDNVQVQLAENVEYTLNVIYESENGVNIENEVNSAIEEYQKWQDETIGQAFNPDRLMAAIYRAGATRVQWGEGSEFDGEDVEYTAIESNQRCKGTITVVTE